MNEGIQAEIDKFLGAHFDHIDNVNKFITHKGQIKTILNDEYVQ